MKKIFLYELKRLLWNKFFVGLCVVLIFYGWQYLSRRTLLGVAHTAPFSPWSFGAYVQGMLPLLWLGALGLLAFFQGNTQKKLAALLQAMPVDRRCYALTQAAAVFTGVVLLMMVVLVTAAVFYGRCFGWYGWGTLAAPAAITLVPPLLFVVGAGWALGACWRGVSVVLALVPLMVWALPLPEALGLWDGTLFTSLPLALDVLDPTFSLPPEVVVVQCVLAVLGLLLLCKNPRRRLR